jgi:hypothetical protein
MAANPEPVTAARTDPARGTPRRGLRAFGRGGRRPPRWWQELAFIVLSYRVYGVIRNHLGRPQPVDCAHPSLTEFQDLACGRAQDLLRLERSLHIDVEHAINAFTARVEGLAVFANYFYATAHFVVTIGVLVWLYRRHPLQYRSMRTVLYVCNLTALAGYWLYSLAPPRFLTSQGYVDTLKLFGTWGSYESGNLSHASNQYAAMPSMHIGWALWAGLALFWLARRPWVRWLGLAYPVVTLLVIMATANHFLLDAVGGAAALTFGFLVQRAMSGEPAVDPQPVSRALRPA